MNQHIEIDRYVGARLRLRRKERDVSQGALGEALGITFQQIQKYERGANRISASMLYQASLFLMTTPAYFFEGLGDSLDAEVPAPPLDLDFPQARMIPALSAKSRRALGGLIESMVG